MYHIFDTQETVFRSEEDASDWDAINRSIWVDDYGLKLTTSFNRVWPFNDLQLLA